MKNQQILLKRKRLKILFIPFLFLFFSLSAPLYADPPQFTFYYPADGETGIPLIPTLQWQASDPDPGDTLVYDIYFGTSSPPPLVVTNQGAPSYTPVQYPQQLPHMTVHYWKIVARDNHGVQTESPILSFTTLSQPPKFITFSPQNKSTGISLTSTLSWSAYDPDPDDTIVYDIYFGTSSTPPPPLVSSNQTASSYQPGMLSYSTRYYWRIVARDNHGAETTLPDTEEPFYFDTESIDIIVDRSPDNVTRPQAAADGNGHVYVVWEDSRNGGSDIYFNYSSDYGVTWQYSDVRLDKDDAGANNSTYPQITCDNNGHIYVVWEDDRDDSSDIYFNVSSDYGVTWLISDKKLSTVPYAPPAQFPQISCDNNGHVYVAWDDNYFSTSANYGATWLAQPIQISNSGGIGTQLTCDQNSHVYIAWRASDILFNYSLNNGSTWEYTDRILSSTGSIPNGISLKSDENGQVYVAWHDGRNNPNSPDIYFNFSSDYGNTWEASDIKLNTGTPGTTYSIWPEVACDAEGHVYVTWYDKRNGLGDIYLNYSSDYGNTWQGSDIRLDTDSPGTVDSGYPEIAVDDSGFVYVVWDDDQSSIGGPGMYLNYSLDYGTTWLPTNKKIGYSGGLNPRITTDGSLLYIVRDNSDIVFTEVAIFRPVYPSPPDKATQVSLIPALRWRGGNLFLDNTLTYDVYFGTSSPPPLVSPNQSGTTYIPGMLNYSSTYYWRVVSRNSSGTETPGPIWSFTTVSTPPQFIDFSPPSGAIGVELINPSLTWTATDPDPGDTLTYDIYFGTSPNPPLKVSNQSAAIYQAGLLEHMTRYYWKIVARDNHGSQTVGPVLSFTTRDNLPQISNYSPNNGATGISLTPTLGWIASDPDPDDTLTYDIYFGTSSPPPLILANQTANSYQPGPLNYLTVYYWKIVVRDNHGGQAESPSLSFTTVSTPPQFLNFSPPDMTADVIRKPTLSWSASDPDPNDVLTYDIHFGTTPSPPRVLNRVATTSYKPGTLNFSTRYYWKIVAYDNYGAKTIGPVLSFITANPPQIVTIDPNPCQANQIISIIGMRFGDTQGTSEIHLGTKVFDPGSPRIKEWTNARIDFKVPAYSAWPSGKTKTVNFWVKVNGFNSNKVSLTINKP